MSQSLIGGDAKHAFVHEADDLNFEDEVIQRSMTTPVLLDCWAEWCEPCKSLGPTLEKLADQYKGRFELVKVDIDKAQRVAMALRVQSVPFMVLFIEGRPVDALVGNQSETQLRTFLDRHLPADEGDPYEHGLESMKNGDYQLALEHFQQALLENPERAEIRLAMSRAALASGDLESSKQLLDSIPADSPEYLSAKNLKQLFVLAEFRENEDMITDRLREDPRDVDAWYRQGVNQALNGHFEPACESFLKVVSLDRSYEDDAGRRALVLIFEVLGVEHEITALFRRTLASYLF